MMEEDIVTGLGMDDHKSARRSHSCRVQVKLQGFQWFMYNRTPSFDSIIDQLMQDLPQRTPSYGTEGRRSMSKGSVIPSFRAPPIIKRFMAWVYSQLPNLDPKELLPLGIDVTKGIIIIGNKSTPNLLLAEFKSTQGLFGVVQSRSKHDLYKQILNLKFQTVLVRYMENKDYCEPMATTGASLDATLRQHAKHEGNISTHGTYQAFAKLWRHYWFYAPRSQRKGPSEKDRGSHNEKHSAPEDLQTPNPNEEYAIERKILEAPILELSYYADVVGEVPPLSEQTEPIGVESFDIGNGGLSPQWGVDIALRNAFIRYGPWADRQRVELQRAFFPPPYHDVLPTRFLNPGDPRIWTNMRVFIELLDETTLHVPFREPSKNWQWDEHSNPRDRPRKREPAAIHLVVGDRSSINYTLPMVVGLEGYSPLLEIHLDTVEVTSSLNDIRLITSESCRIHGEMPSPLKWDAERKWSFGVTLRQPLIYLIRDHINMITDLVKDFTSGPPHDYYRFVPTIYELEFELHHYVLNLYVNDHNIIDKPLIKEENALVTLRGYQMKSNVLVPSNEFRPDTTCVPFTIELPNVALNLSLPKWNTNALHAPKDGDNIGHIVSLHIDASYRYYADIKEDNIEQLKLSFKARQVAFKSLGWAIRYFMVMRENYFGAFTHFSTLREYLEKQRSGLMPGDPIEAKYRPGTTNSSEIEVSIVVDDAIMVVPAGLPGYEAPIPMESKPSRGIGACVVMALPQLQLHLRTTEHYMEMSLNIDPVSCYVKKDFPAELTRKAFKRPKQDTLLVDGINIVANRLFGPQPRTSTYLCIWEIQIGDIKGVLSAWDCQVLGITGRNFGLNYVDATNAPAAEYMPPLDPDVTIVKASLRSVEFTWLAEPAALVVSLPKGIKVDLNDKPGAFHKKLASLMLPTVSVKILHATPSSRKTWLEAAAISLDLDVDIYTAPKNWRLKAMEQNNFVNAEDHGTGRAQRMIIQYDRARRLHKGGFYLPQPMVSTISAPPIPARPSEKPRPNRRLSGPQRWSRLSHLSESDSEEGISEAVRDARLAKTRSVTPIPLIPANEDDLNMSGGDESDDEDLTADSSDSDWSEASTPQSSDPGLLKMYFPCVRRYGQRSLQVPSLWDGCPFFIRNDPHPRFKLSPPVPTPTGTFGDKLTSGNTTIIRFRSTRGIHVNFTPLALPALVCLQDQAASKIDSSWESATTKVSSRGPDYILSIALALQDSFKPMHDVFSGHGSYRSLAIQRLVHDIIQTSNGKPMVDSLSTFQPSYLVQSGISRDLRNDSTIRFLFHLRSCLQFLDPRDRQAFLATHVDTQNLSMRDTLALLESRLKDLALDDVPSIGHLRTLEETLFPNRKPSVPQAKRYTVRSAHIVFGKTILLVVVGDEVPASSLTISSLKLLVDFRLCAFAPRGSQTSLVSSTSALRKISVVSSVEDLALAIQPQLLTFAQRLLHLRSLYMSRRTTEESPLSRQASKTDKPVISTSLVLSFKKFGIQAAAQNLIFELELCGAESIITALSNESQQSANASLKFQDIILRARSPVVSSKGPDRDILASISLSRGSTSLIFSQEPKSISSVALAFTLGGISIRVPRSALRLYRFVQEWRADFLPGIEGMAQALLKELKTTAPSKPAPTPQGPLNFRVNGKVLSTKVSLQVMHGMWLSWEVQDMFTHFKSSNITKRSHIAFGAQISSQTFTISSNSSDLRNTLTRVRFAVPQITVAGNHDGNCIHILTLVEEFRAKVKPSHWDTLLAVQQKFGQDFTEFLTLAQKTQAKRATVTQPAPVPSNTIKYVADLKVKGFRIGLEGLSSTLFLECSDVYGGVTSVGGLSWQVDLSNLALSLAPRAVLDPRHTAFSTTHRTAFVIVDVYVHAKGVDIDVPQQKSGNLKIEISKVHAVMQPSSIGEVGDFIDHLQAEMLERREQRALEVAAFKERTRQFLQTFETPAKDASSTPATPWLQTTNVDITIQQIGIAFPLTLDQELEMPKSGRGSNSFKAFLVSIKSITFGAQQGETGQAMITNFSFQFVPR
ncbi:hypothetical protein ONZ45_g11120 [Pleurotus djamor]|nr:hypothetical protein ONZ45_g11120 [Pleurotus djamor]